MTAPAEAEISRLIGFYLSIERASRDMLAAALEGDWDRVASTQTQVDALIDQVRTLNARVALSREEQRIKLRIVRQIVQNEAKLRRLSSPWSDRYEQLVFGVPPDPARAGPGGAR